MQSKYCILAVAALAACAAGGVSAGDKMDPTKASGPTTVKEDDLEFMTKAAQTGLTEVQEGQLASSHALDADVRAFADTMVADHTKAGDALKELAAKKGVTLPSELDHKHKDVLEELQKKDAKKFDHEYIENQVKEHDAAVELFDKASKKAKDPDLRALAASTLPTLQHHDAMVKELKKKIDK